jgi:hypothetical protein
MTRDEETINQNQEKTDEQRRPYEPPAWISESVFEKAALACNAGTNCASATS